MMSEVGEKTTFGATIIRKEPSPADIQKPAPSHHLISNPSLDTLAPYSTAAAPEPEPAHTEDYDPTSNNPFSAFYTHPKTRTDIEISKSESKLHLPLYAHDLESGDASFSEPVPQIPAQLRRTDNMWPCAKSKEKTMMEKQRNKGCSPFSRLSRRQRFWAHILIAVIVAGAITGLAVGITKAVHGGVFKNSSDSSAPISR